MKINKTKISNLYKKSVLSIAAYSIMLFFIILTYCFDIWDKIQKVSLNNNLSILDMLKDPKYIIEGFMLKETWFVILCLTLIIFSIRKSKNIINKMKEYVPSKYNIGVINNVNTSKMLGSFGIYIFPYITLALKDKVAIGIFITLVILTIGLCSNSNSIYFNPIMKFILGYNYYSVELKDPYGQIICEKVMLISREAEVDLKRMKGKKVDMYRMTKGTYIMI